MHWISSLCCATPKIMFRITQWSLYMLKLALIEELYFFVNQWQQQHLSFIWAAMLPCNPSFFNMNGDWIYLLVNIHALFALEWYYKSIVPFLFSLFIWNSYVSDLSFLLQFALLFLNSNSGENDFFLWAIKQYNWHSIAKESGIMSAFNIFDFFKYLGCFCEHFVDGVAAYKRSPPFYIIIENAKTNFCHTMSYSHLFPMLIHFY